MIKYTSQSLYNAIFDFKAQGPVEEGDILGALLSESTSLFQEYSISKLQQKRKVGKLNFNLKHQKDGSGITKTTTGSIEIPVNLERIETSLFCSMIESIKKVGSHSAQIKLAKIGDSYSARRYRVISRAKEIYLKFFEDSGEEGQIGLLKQSLTSALDKAKPLTVGKFTLGPDFYDEEKIIILEGKADVNTLFRAGISNTIGIGGLEYDAQALEQMVNKKSITLFLDGDRGGQLLGEKLKSHLNISDVVPTPKNTSVEDLSRRQILTLLAERTPWV